LNPSRGRKFPSFPKYTRHALEPMKPLIYWVPTRALLCVAEWPGQADHLPPYSNEIKNNGSYTSTPPLCLMAYVGKNLVFNLFFFVLCRCDPTRVMASSFLRFLDHTRSTTVRRTSLDEWSARRRDLYLTTHNTHNRQTSMLPVGFNSFFNDTAPPEIYTATGTGFNLCYTMTIKQTHTHTHTHTCDIT
jgi:hypothetical protein